MTRTTLTLVVLGAAWCFLGHLPVAWADDDSHPRLRNEIVENGVMIHVPGPNPLIRVGPEGAWDDRILEASMVFKDGNTYYFYYHAQGQKPEHQGYRLGVATAPRPLGPFIRYGTEPLVDQGPDGAWDGDNVACATVLKEGENTYYLWYWAAGSQGWKVGLAYGSSPVGPWKKYENNPVMDDFGYVGGVVKVGKKYHMYNTYPVNSTSPDQGPICLAIADKPEGPWRHYQGNPVVPQGDWGTWDDGGYSEAGMVYHNGVFHTFYAGVKWLKLESIGYAYSFDGFNFIKYSANPVAPREHNPNAASFAEVHAMWEPPFFYLYHTMRYISRGTMDRTRGGEELGVQIIATQTPFRLAMPVLSLDSLAGGASSTLADCPPICLSNITDLALTVGHDFHAQAEGGVTYHVRASWDGLNYDSEDLHAIHIHSAPGQQISKTVPLDANVMYVKVIVENLDPDQELTNINVTATVGQD